MSHSPGFILGRAVGRAEAQLERLRGKRTPKPQIACDRCSVGVMDATNPHLWGDCDCECHAA